MIIVFYGEGRLGNQLFQYQALSRLAGRAGRIFAVGLEDLASTVELLSTRVSILTRRPGLKRVVKYLLVPLLLRPLSRGLRLFSYATEKQSGNGSRRGADGEVFLRPGLISSIVFVEGGHYQNASLWGGQFPATSVRVLPALRAAAREILVTSGPAHLPRAFVHVRRGDYLSYSSYGLRDLSLPGSFYRAAIAALTDRLGALQLVFVTDDPGWVESEFADVPGKYLVSLNQSLDFAVMTECTAGVLSNSTYSLAAALLVDGPRLLIGPRYWFGFRIREWLPPKIRFDHPRLVYLAAASEPT